MENPGSKPNDKSKLGKFICEIAPKYHRIEWIESTPQETLWKCIICGKEITEYEDCGTGA